MDIVYVGNTTDTASIKVDSERTKTWAAFVQPMCKCYILDLSADVPVCLDDSWGRRWKSFAALRGDLNCKKGFPPGHLRHNAAALSLCPRAAFHLHPGGGGAGGLEGGLDESHAADAVMDIREVKFEGGRLAA